jgi:hypothetical protein
MVWMRCEDNASRIVNLVIRVGRAQAHADLGALPDTAFISPRFGQRRQP